MLSLTRVRFLPTNSLDENKNLHTCGVPHGGVPHVATIAVHSQKAYRI